MTKSALDIVTFWKDEVGVQKWYMGSPELDQEIVDRFMATYEAARDGKLDHWQEDATGSLAMLLLLDQFPRNMFRGDPRSFATDAKARDVARHAIESGQDLEVEGLIRQFFYLPFEHSESLADQDYGYEKFSTSMPDLDLGLLHARSHREIIRRYGRFPFRNDALGRESTAEEKEFMDAGGYMAFTDRFEKTGDE